FISRLARSGPTVSYCEAKLIHWTGLHAVLHREDMKQRLARSGPRSRWGCSIARHTTCASRISRQLSDSILGGMEKLDRRPFGLLAVQVSRSGHRNRVWRAAYVRASVWRLWRRAAEDAGQTS